MRVMGTLVSVGALATMLLMQTGCQKQPEDVVKSWRKLDLKGVPVVPNEDITFLRQHLPGSVAALRMGLVDDEVRVRFCAGYAVYALGASVAELAPDVREAFQREHDADVRRTLVSALGSIGDRSEVTRTVLREEFGRTDNDPLTKCDLACALVKLYGPAAEADAWSWLLRAMKANSELDRLPQRWPMLARWRIATMIEALPDAPPDGLKALEALRSDPAMQNYLGPIGGRGTYRPPTSSRPASRP